MLSPTTLKIGVRVRSVAIGRKPAFEGTIECRCNAGYAGWHIRADDDGRLWFRIPKELTFIEMNAGKPPPAIAKAEKP